MAKTISVDQQAALEQRHVLPVIFAEVDWDEGLERYVTAGASIAWNSYTWTGIGDLIDIAPVKETGSVESTAVRFSMALIDSSRIAQALSTKSQGKRITLYFGTLNPDTMALTDDPIVEFEGRMDYPTLTDGATATISILAESRMAGLLGANVRRYTDADQQAWHAGDTYCKYSAVIAEKSIVFPSREVLRR